MTQSAISLMPIALQTASCAQFWDRKAAGLELTQTKAANALGISQGAVSQYLNGDVPLRVVATLRFAKLLKVRATDIRPDVAELAHEFSPEALYIATHYMKLSPAQRERFAAILSLATDPMPKFDDEWTTPKPGPVTLVVTDSKKNRQQVK